MQRCSLCSPGQHGYLLEIDSPESMAHLHAFLSESKLAFDQTADEEVWVAASALKDCVECCALFSPVHKWQFRAALRMGAGQYDAQSTRAGWDEVSKKLPVVFIDTLIESNAVRMMQQPIVDVTLHGKIVAYEMLARGFDADGSIVPPVVLFGEARAQNRLFALDKHCRIEAVKTAAQLPEDASVFINFIPTAIYRPEHCLRTTMAAAREFRVDPDQIVFEVVETDFVEDTAHLKTIFDYYRNNGIRCALDDVGSGFNGVEMLEALAPNFVKLDRSIADGVAKSAQQQDQAAEIQRAAAQVGAIALAEGIESIEDSRVLAMMGYSWQQGYLFGKPVFAAHYDGDKRLAA